MSIRQLWVSKREGLISLVVLVTLLLFFFVLFLNPIVSQVERYRAELAKDARILQQLRAVDNARDILDSTFEEYQSRELQSWVYSKVRPDAATLDVQRRVSSELTNAGAQVKSISPLPVKMENDYLTVGVQVSFIASMPALVEALNVLEQEKPLLVIDSIRISPQQTRRLRRGEVPEQLVGVQMTVLTFLVDDGDEVAAL